MLKYENLRTDDYLVYLRHGDHHRINGPSVIWAIGDMFWYRYQLLHRVDGPAIETISDTYYYIGGVCYNKSDYESEIRS